MGDTQTILNGHLKGKQIKKVVFVEKQLKRSIIPHAIIAFVLSNIIFYFVITAGFGVKSL